GAVSSTGDASETRNGTETGGSSNVSAEETVNTTVTATRMDAAASHHSSPSTPTQHQPSRHQRYVSFCSSLLR
ncbi:unnamed protein product, partial [Anisakis simplex]|uniref:Pecanex-like protein n=1 Tax=Anisakis simplex TaxID=6269 RepID=A0A0M3JPB9_ANISI